MAVAAADAITSPRMVASGRFNRPCLDLLEQSREARRDYLELCVPLKKYAQKGNWIKAKQILDRDRRLRNAAITSGWQTVLHVAVGAKDVDFVEKLLELLSTEDLELQDGNGNNAFCFTAAAGNMEIVRLLLRENPRLPTIRGGSGMTPLQFAALQGRSEMADFLYRFTYEIFDDLDWSKVFFTCINTGIYDVASRMLEGRPELAWEGDENGETALHILAQMPSEFGCQILEHQNEHTMKKNSSVKKNLVLVLVESLWKEILREKDLVCIKGVKKNLVLVLVESLWKEILREKDSDEIKGIICHPSQLLFDATIAGNYQFVTVLMRNYPDLIWQIDDRNRSIIHIAVLHRHANIFNLVHEIGSEKDILTTYVDSNDENSLLHLAAKLAPTDHLNLISGAAFQMSLELLWFEEVKKIMQPSFIKMKNAAGMTPHKLFTVEHETLRKNAEDWMKNRAQSCMLVSTLVVTGVFAAAFSVPGGTDDDTGNPNYLKKSAFMIFAISDSIALISSSISTLIFVSILISRYAEYDFYKRLPLKLIFGLITLFISITSMMITFSTSFFITYYHGLKWVPGFISILVILPILLFVYLQFPLWSDIFYSTYYCRFLFKPSKNML